MTQKIKGHISGHLSVVQTLLRVSACDVTLTNERGMTCPMIAAYADRADVLKMLVRDERCDVTARDNQGRNVLFYAVAAGKVDTLAFLLDYGAEVQSDNHG